MKRKLADHLEESKSVKKMETTDTRSAQQCETEFLIAHHGNQQKYIEVSKRVTETQDQLAIARENFLKSWNSRTPIMESIQEHWIDDKFRYKTKSDEIVQHPEIKHLKMKRYYLNEKHQAVL